MEEEKETHEKNFTNSIRGNPWILSTIALGVLVLVLLVGSFGITGNAISENDASKIILDFAKAQTGEDITLSSVNKVNGLYEVNIIYKGSEVPLYLTLDGKNLVQGLTPLNALNGEEQNSETQEIPKTDKPSVELYVFTYCPYGLQMEKATISVVKLLGDKINFKIRQIGAMHGEYEKIEAERQLCVEKNYPDKFLDYLTAFAESSDIGSCSGDATCLTPKINALYTKLGIDKTKIETCMKNEGENLYGAEVANSEAKGVSGSPTVLINGVSASVSRSSAGVLDGICQAFNTAPEACGTQLSSTSSSAGFGTGSGSSSSAQC